MRLFPYVLERRVALGGMAEIWLATEVKEASAPRQVALKILQPEYASDTLFRAMFLDEVRIVRRLHHEGIVEIFDVIEVEGHLIQAMPYIDGSDLRRVMAACSKANARVPVEIALGIARRTASALGHAHGSRGEDGRSLRIVHRDVSPHNIMIARDGRVVLLDFGIARAAERITRTRTGIVKGKVAYMAPEQAMALEVTPRTDIFALGVVLWEMLAMRRLFFGDSDARIIELVIRAEVPPIRSLNSDVPEEVETLVAGMLARDPEDRPSSMDLVEHALGRALSRRWARAVDAPENLAHWVAPFLEPVRAKTTPVDVAAFPWSNGREPRAPRDAAAPSFRTPAFGGGCPEPPLLASVPSDISCPNDPTSGLVLPPVAPPLSSVSSSGGATLATSSDLLEVARDLRPPDPTHVIEALDADSSVISLVDERRSSMVEVPDALLPESGPNDPTLTMSFLDVEAVRASLTPSSASAVGAKREEAPVPWGSFGPRGRPNESAPRPSGREVNAAAPSPLEAPMLPLPLPLADARRPASPPGSRERADEQRLGTRIPTTSEIRRAVAEVETVALHAATLPDFREDDGRAKIGSASRTEPDDRARSMRAMARPSSRDDRRAEIGSASRTEPDDRARSMRAVARPSSRGSRDPSRVAISHPRQAAVVGSPMGAAVATDRRARMLPEQRLDTTAKLTIVSLALLFAAVFLLVYALLGGSR